MISEYLKKRCFQPITIKDAVDGDVDTIVVIPCYNEPDIIATIKSILACLPPTGKVEVVIVVNDSEIDSVKVKQQNEATLNAITAFVTTRVLPKWLKLFTIYAIGLPKKHAGVGLARKIGMDEAAFRFEKANKPNGVIVCLDADSHVADSYFIEIEKAFNSNLDAKAASIYYEHPTSGQLDKDVYKGIVLYELHLRYYINAIRYTGYPFAYHTIGSSMAVRNTVYQQQGGMNKRKAGEDFYFLHKLMPLGGFIEINTTTVIPSPRVSDRVPFGTGKAIGDWLETKEVDYLSYNLEIFSLIKFFLKDIDKLFGTTDKDLKRFIAKQHIAIQSFLREQKFIEKVYEFNLHSTTKKVFRYRFFTWLNGFRLLKLVHYLRDNGYPNTKMLEDATTLLKWLHINTGSVEPRALLKTYRNLDQSGFTSF